MKRLMFAVAAAAIAVLLLALSGAAFGHAPEELLSIQISGSIGSRFAFEGTLLKSVPLLLTGLSVAVAFRAGVWNIGAEGQFIVGAIAGLLASRWGVAAALIASMLAGAAWSSIATAMRLLRNAPEVLTTILLNFTAIHLLGWCVNGPLRERAAQYPQSDPAGAALPMLAGELHAGTAIALAASITLWFLIHRTREGLRLRATGFNPNAAQWAGVNVRAQLARAMAISGAVAGLAGGIELLGVTHRLFERFASGYGYSGIAVALLAQLHPIATIVSAMFFGALVTGAGELQRAANISSGVAVLGQAVVILTLIAFDHVRARR
ncbi:MAG TPA: ABC transporter permease [Thermoanaerobaculia bacterium]|nr:ABC transporter permease [Thermoanaerobaculia bacterium]